MPYLSFVVLFSILHRLRGSGYRWLAYFIPATFIAIAYFTRLPFIPVLAFSLAYMLRWNLPHGPFFTLGKGQANNRQSPKAFRFFDAIKHAFPNDYWGSIVVLLIMDTPFLIAGVVAGLPLVGLLTMLGSTASYIFWFSLPLHDKGINPVPYAELTGGAIYGFMLLMFMGLF